jgi:nicotinamidase-related amidase
MMPTRSRFTQSRTALLLIDVINPFDFEGGKAFARKALRVARAIGRLRDRVTDAGIPVIYVNDNFGRWRSDMLSIVAYCIRPDMPGARVVDVLKPRKTDYVVLKSTLSGFFQTPLETMLRLGGVKTLIVTGFAADNCVLFTAADAYMRDFRLVVPHDCIGAKTKEAQHRALRMMAQLFGAKTGTSSRLGLAGRP